MIKPRPPTLQEVISDDVNVEVWSAMMRKTLTEKGLLDVVENGVPPNPLKIPEVASSLKVEDLCKWIELVRKDMKALQILQSSLPDSVYKMTLSAAATAKDLWDMVEYLPEYKFLVNYSDDLTYDEDMWTICSSSASTTNHMTPYEKYFTTLDRSYRARVIFIGGDIAIVQGMGDANVVTKEGIKKTIKNVLYVPGIVANTLSVDQMERSGYEVNMGTQKCSIWDKSTGKVFGGKKEGFFFVLR